MSWPVYAICKYTNTRRPSGTILIDFLGVATGVILLSNLKEISRYRKNGTIDILWTIRQTRTCKV